MTYKKHLIFLLSLIAVLALVYTASIVFSYDMGSTRSASYVWLDSGTAGRINRIVINAELQEYELVKRNDQWFVLHPVNGRGFPARRLRIEDFLGVLATRSPWPVRTTSANAHERFGLDENASRITIYAEGSILLDLLVGYDDATGFETYLRKADQNEVRSGDNSLKTYITRPAESWYNLRLVSESESGNVNVSGVQRLSVFTPSGEQHFTRRNRGWEITGIVVDDPDFNAVENYIRDIINTEGMNFEEYIAVSDPIFNHSRIVLEFGNGRVINIRFSESSEADGSRLAHVTGREYIYIISGWTAGRLFMEAGDFEGNN